MEQERDFAQCMSCGRKHALYQGRRPLYCECLSEDIRIVRRGFREATLDEHTRVLREVVAKAIGRVVANTEVEPRGNWLKAADAAIAEVRKWGLPNG